MRRVSHDCSFCLWHARANTTLRLTLGETAGVPAYPTPQAPGETKKPGDQEPRQDQVPCTGGPAGIPWGGVAEGGGSGRAPHITANPCSETLLRDIGVAKA